MSKAKQIILAIICWLVSFFILIPLLPNAYYIPFIAQVLLIIFAIFWLLKISGIWDV